MTKYVPDEYFPQKVCLCDSSVPYYKALDRMGQIIECVGCGNKTNLKTINDYLEHDSNCNPPPKFIFVDRPESPKKEG